MKSHIRECCYSLWRGNRIAKVEAQLFQSGERVSGRDRCLLEASRAAAATAACGGCFCCLIQLKFDWRVLFKCSITKTTTQTITTTNTI